MVRGVCGTALLRLAAGAVAVAAAIGAPATTLPAAAQSPPAYCERLRGDIAALERAGASARGQGSQAAIQRQRAELDRTVAYARSIGCQRQRFLMFGEPPPPQCGQLEAQINRMASSLMALESQADRYGGGAIEAQRAALVATYDANCRGAAPPMPVRGAPGFFERLFGAQQEDPVTGVEEAPPPLDAFGLGGSVKTLCVRKCDGYYFPISTSTSRNAFETDSAICQASCPNAEVELFLQPSSGRAEEAVALDGTPYASLPNAFRYRKTYDAACSCRRPGQSWSEALVEAERIVGVRKSDIVVTEEKAQELSRPREPQAAPAAPAATPRGTAPRAGTRQGAQPPATPPTAAGPARAPGAPTAAPAPTAPAPAASSTAPLAAPLAAPPAAQARPAAPAPADIVRPDGSRVRVVAPAPGAGSVQQPR